MRVIAGRLRGLTIQTPPTDSVRPTYDRVRESLFGIIEPRLPGSVVLDLFAGSGSLGIESASRGAASVTFVEKDPGVVRVVNRNLRELGLAMQCRVVRGDAVKLLRGSVPGGPFDVVFVDPPYASGLAREVLEILGASDALNPGALVVVERSSDDDALEGAGSLRRTRTKRYGTTAVDLYEARTADPGGEEQT